MQHSALYLDVYLCTHSVSLPNRGLVRSLLTVTGAVQLALLSVGVYIVVHEVSDSLLQFSVALNSSRVRRIFLGTETGLTHLLVIGTVVAL